MYEYDVEKKRTLWSINKAFEHLTAACVRAEQCEADLLLKMRTHGMSSADAAHVLEQLRKNKFVDNARYARAYAVDKLRFNGWGRTKITMMLRSKHIAPEHIKAALDTLDPDVYTGVLKRLVNAEARKLNLDLYTDRLKLTRKLYSRGFEVEVIKEAIAEYRESAEV